MTNSVNTFESKYPKRLLELAKEHPMVAYLLTQYDEEYRTLEEVMLAIIEELVTEFSSKDKEVGSETTNKGGS